MATESSDASVLGAIVSVLRPSRPVLVAFGLLVALVLQYVLRRPLSDFTPGWFETWLPFEVLDRVMELLLVPVFSIVDVFYEQFAPDWIVFGLVLCYFYVLAAAIAFLYERAAPSVRRRA